MQLRDAADPEITAVSVKLLVYPCIPKIPPTKAKNIAVESAPESGEINSLVMGSAGGRATRSKSKAFRMAGPKPNGYERKRKKEINKPNSAVVSLSYPVEVITEKFIKKFIKKFTIPPIGGPMIAERMRNLPIQRSAD